MSTVTNKSLSLVDLPDYINQNSTELIQKAVLNIAPSTKEFKLQTGVKAETAINLLDTTITFGDGKSCGFSQNSNSAISQRYLRPGFMKVNAEYCDKDLLGTFASHMVAVGAGRETLPFEEYFANDIINGISEEVEKLVWQGDTSLASGNLKWTDGLIKIMTADVPVANVVSLDAETSVYEMIWKVYKKVPANVKFNVNVYVGRDMFTDFCYELTNKNMYHYTAEDNTTQEVVLPGTTCKVKAMPGLDGTGMIVALDPKKVVYGVDLEDDKETMKMVYFEREETFGLKVNFAVAVQIARPDEIAYGVKSNS